MAFTHYLEIELPRLYLVSAVATLGDKTAGNYVKTYKIVYGIEGKEWETASVDGSQVIRHLHDRPVTSGNHWEEGGGDCGSHRCELLVRKWVWGIRSNIF